MRTGCSSCGSRGRLPPRRSSSSQGARSRPSGARIPGRSAGWSPTAPRRSPHLRAALRRLLEELPWTRDGLSRTERQLLEAVGNGAGTPTEAFSRAQAGEEAAFLGDVIAFDLLDELAAGPAPLLDGPPLRLTVAGARVLAGELDRLDLTPLDRWLGGTRLAGSDVWRFEAGRGEPVAPASSGVR